MTTVQLQNNYSKVQYYCEENYIYIKTDDRVDYSVALTFVITSFSVSVHAR